MRIIILNYEYPPLGGGAGNATFYLLQEFSKIPSLRVDLVTSSTDRKYHLEKIGENIRIHKLPIGKNISKMHFQTSRDLLVYSWKAYWFSRKLVKKEKFDVILAFFGIPCGYIAKKLGIPYIVSLRGSDIPFYNKRFNLLDKLFFRQLSRIIWQKSGAVVALSYDSVNLARQTSKNQEIRVVYNGINTEEFYPNSEVLKKEATTNILFEGRLIERKGLRYLLEAMSQLVPDYPNIKLIVVSDGPLREKYETYVREHNLLRHVDFLGILEHDKMANVYQRSHIFVLPSLNEALANATQEALASGLPIITTKTGAAELIEDNKNGYIVEKASSKAIYEKIKTLLDNPVLRENMAKRSRELSKKMTWRNVANHYIEIFESVISKKKEESKQNRSKFKLIFKAFFMVAFLTWIFFKVDWQEVLGYFEKMDIWWMGAFVLIYTFGIAISSYKWKILANFKGFQMKFQDFFKIYLTGAFINNFFPSIIGGDTYRSYKLGKSQNGKYIEATSTVLVDRITGFAGVMMLIFIFSLFNLEVVFQNNLLLIINIGIILFFATNFLLIIIRRLSIWQGVKKFLPEKIVKMIQEILSYQRNEILAKSLAWGMIFNFIGVSLATWMLFLDLHIPISFVNFMIAISIISIASSIPVSIGNIGIKEWSFIAFFGIFGVDGEAAISIAIFGRFLQMLVSFFAVPYYLKEKNKKL